MRRLAAIGFAVVWMVCASQPAWAARTRFHVAAESPLYSEKIGGMIGRGLLNMVTGFMDVLVTTVNETKVGPPFIGSLRGFATGFGCGVLRMGSGAVDVTTFWVPGFNGFPVSDSYDDCLSWEGSSASFDPLESSLDAVTLGPSPVGAAQQTIAKTPEAVEPIASRNVWKK